MNPRYGFTLIEVLLSLAIFSLIGIATVKHIQQIQNTKDTAFEEMDMYNSLRAGISLMRFDLTQAFHIPYDDLGEENRQAIMQNQPVPHTLFDGRKNEIVFTSLSHRVYYTNKHECEQTEISYFLQKKDGAKFPSLMKRESEIIDADLFRGGSIYGILDNVASLEFQYWDDKQAKWMDDWNSDNGAYRDRFPLAIKMKVAVTDQNNKNLKLETEFKLAFPNNDSTLVQF